MYSFGRVQSQASNFRLIQALPITTDGSEDLLIHCLTLSQPCAESLEWLNWLNCVFLQERQDPSETSGGLTRTCKTQRQESFSGTHLHPLALEETCSLQEQLLCTVLSFHHVLQLVS